MGRPRIKVMDESQAESEIKSQKSKIKTSNKKEGVAKSSAAKAIGEVETTESVIASEAEGEARQSSADEKDRHVVPQSGTPRDDEKKETKPQKPGKAKPRSKKYKQSLLFFDKKSQEIDEPDRGKFYPINEAVDMVKKLSYAKFNATLEAHITTLQTGLRGLVSLPYAKGRQLRILAFGPSTSSQLEGVVFGTNSTIDEISQGKIDFDLLITTPEWMPKLTKVARILGPRGLMPNPKNGTITSGEAGLKKSVESFQAGKTEYRTEPKAPVIHLALGKLNQPDEELVANIKTLLMAIGKSRIKKVSLSPTMGPGVKLDLSSI